MGERSEETEELIAEEGKLVRRVRELEVRWQARKGAPGDPVLRPYAEELLEDAARLADRVTPLFLDAPITSLNDAKLGWAVYEIANARLNLIHLLLFGVNQVKARQANLIPAAQR